MRAQLQERVFEHVLHVNSIILPEQEILCIESSLSCNIFFLLTCLPIVLGKRHVPIMMPEKTLRMNVTEHNNIF